MMILLWLLLKLKLNEKYTKNITWKNLSCKKWVFSKINNKSSSFLSGDFVALRNHSTFIYLIKSQPLWLINHTKPYYDIDLN